VTGMSRDELRETIACSREIFENVARVGEAGDGELPFRIETREIGGETKRNLQDLRYGCQDLA
jgi:hypothetical protein